MKLFCTSLGIATKHSGQRLLCLFCIFALCTALLLGVTSAAGHQDTNTTASVAVRCLDTHPFIPMAIQAVAQSGELAELVSVELLQSPDSPTEGYTAVVTLPEGFVESILNGQNLSPVVEINMTSPLEAIFVRQLADAAARTLTAAQQGVYAVQQAVDYGNGMPAQRYLLVLASINMVFVRAFADRLSLITTETLSPTGGLSLGRYYLAALVSLLLLAYVMLYRPAVTQLRRLAARLTAKQGWQLFASASCHMLLLNLAATMPLVAIALYEGTHLPQAFTAWCLLALLCTAYGLLPVLLLPTNASCGAGSLLAALGFGLCSGSLLPLSLMPAAFGSIAPLLPTYHARLLAGAMLGDGLSTSTTVVVAVMIILFGTIAALLWHHGLAKVEVAR